MNEWELRVSREKCHRMDVVRLTIEGRETVGEIVKAFRNLTPSDEAVATQDERARDRGIIAWPARQERRQQNSLCED